ncbi:MAG: chorismate synthase [Deltaproteobacteria bacterium]|nr:chorismate synthase [Deltaproteobacteria bacterium]
MAGNTFGQAFRLTTFGESHGPAMGVLVDGCPPGLTLNEPMIQEELDKRKPGQASFSSPRQEPDQVQVLSGIMDGLTTGAPIAMIVYNRDAKSKAYETMRRLFRPGHADITYFQKYGIRDHRGGGRSSARETLARVAGGVVAQALLDRHGIQVIAYTLELGGVRARRLDLTEADKNEIRSPDPDVLPEMRARLAQAREAGDSVGGMVEARVQNCPAGLGEPVFDKLDADLAKGLMSIGAVKAVEVGAGIEAARLLGSENNDPITPDGFAANRAGGILGGISNGDEIVVRAAVKPIPSIAKEQQTVDMDFRPATISIQGRHDVSAIPRIVPVCRAMIRLVLADHLLRQKAVRS